jgi:hypothetical protein
MKATDLQDLLDHQASWRIREITEFQTLIASSEHAQLMVRAALPLFYAHWEGFVKAACSGYANFICTQSIGYIDLTPELAACWIHSRLDEAICAWKKDGSASFVGNIVEAFSNTDSLTGDMSPKHLGTRTGNLRFNTFKRIAEIMGFDSSPYESSRIFIDKRLVPKRNAIAHGEELNIDQYLAIDTADKVIVLIQMVKMDIEDAVSATKYCD